MTRFRLASICFSLVFACTALAAPAQEPQAEPERQAEPEAQPDTAEEPQPWTAEFRAGPLWIGNAAQSVDTEDGSDKVQGSAVSPLRLTPGAAAHYRFSPALSLVIALEGLWQEYVELPSGAPYPGKVVPTSSHTGSDTAYIQNPPPEGEELELQNVAGVLILPLHIGVESMLFRSDLVSNGPGGGITIMSRIPFLIEGSDTTGILAYHWGAGRFLYPELTWTAVFHNFSTFDYGVRLRTLYPLANLYALESGVSGWDRLTLQLQVFVRLR